MYTITFSNQFKKDYKRIKTRNYNLAIFEKAYDLLEETGTLPIVPFKTHTLKGDFNGYHEAHLTPDWLIIWKKSKNEIHLVRMGTHSDLF
jgi:mRNA interferase YafQ